MGRSSGTFGKREKEKQRLQKRKDKERRKEERKANNKEKSFDEMIAYVDENGNFSSTPPDVSKKRAVNENDIDLSSRNKGGAAAPYQFEGVVKYFDTDKGFGFIKDNDTGEEFFFHHSSVSGQVNQSDKVKFEKTQTPKGMSAIKVSKITDAANSTTTPTTQLS